MAHLGAVHQQLGHLRLSDFELVRQGAEARLHVGKFLGMKAIVKERFPKKYRHPDLDERLTKERLKSEVRSLLRCKSIGVRTPCILFTDLDSGILVLEHLDQALTCKHFIQSCSDEAVLTELAEAIGELVARLHRHAIIHGDLTTSNVLVETSQPRIQLCLIDFGLSFTDSSAEAKAVDLYVLERALVSTHPQSKGLFQGILDEYRRQHKNDAKTLAQIMGKFEEVRLRGRKRTMVG